MTEPGRKKHLPRWLSAVVLAGALGITDYNLGCRIINFAYCNTVGRLVPAKKKREVRVCVAHTGLSLEERTRAYDSFKMAAREFEERFGIALDAVEYVDIGRIEGDTSIKRLSRAAGAASKQAHDLSIVFTSEDYYLTEKDIVGVTSVPYRLTLIDTVSRHNRWDLTQTVLHEIAHLFYAGHVKDRESLMYRSMTSEQIIYGMEHAHSIYGKWDEETKNILREYKWRVW